MKPGKNNCLHFFKQGRRFNVLTNRKSAFSKKTDKFQNTYKTEYQNKLQKLLYVQIFTRNILPKDN